METVIVTSKFLERGKSDKGGWSREQLALLGIPWPPKKGWKFAILGAAIPTADAERFLSLGKKESK